MSTEIKRIHYVLAGLSFLTALLTYLFTMQPTIPFWDCGEFAAAAWALQIPHPPGAPLWTLVGRIGMLIPIFQDPVARYNFLSVLSSAASILLLYLTLVKLIRMWRGEPKNVSEAAITLGGAFIGALTYAWTDSFWFNAVECEVYAFGSLFISLVPWLMLVWHENADEPGSERCLMLIAYVIGLSLGVHQLALLTMFPVFMIVYYRRRADVTLPSWLGMVAMASVMFIVIFIVILSKLVDWAGHGMSIVSVIILLALIGGVIWSERARKPFASLALWSCLLVFLGYTTYGFVIVRASQGPPMNQNAPSTFAKLSGYINRDQYGGWKLFPRRLEEQKAEHPSTWENYTSDADFFLRYQTNFMYHRYLGWNFIGRTDDDMGAGVDPSKTWGLPFALGLFGFIWHFKRDPKRALTLFAMFIIMGYLTDWYQNQQDPQPRERDYFYVGAFYVFAMWVGIGAVGLMELLQERLEIWRSNRSDAALGTRERSQPMMLAAFGLLLLVIPVNLCIGLAGLATGHPFSQSSKWAEYSRKHNRVPWEYAYNILQGCEPDAILFTYGDNDTFPLWCLQDVYGIRRDIRIVQLQLSSMTWYIDQLHDATFWGGKPIKLTTFTREITRLPDAEAFPKVNFRPQPVSMSVEQKTAQWFSGDDHAAATTFNWTPKIQMPSDLVVMDIIQNNFADRPIYYSVTVPDNARAGLNDFIVYEGLVGRVTPFQQRPDPTGLGGEIARARYASFSLTDAPSARAQADRGMILESYRDPEAHLSGMDNRYAMTYRMQYIRLANWATEHGDPELARAGLDTMEARMPISHVPLEYPYADILSNLADKSGDPALSKLYAEAGARGLEAIMKEPNWRENDVYAKQMPVDYTYGTLLMRAGRFADARKQFSTLMAQSPDRSAGDFYHLMIDEVDAMELESRGDHQGAYEKFKAIISAYRSSGSSQEETDIMALRAHLSANARAAGIMDTAK